MMNSWPAGISKMKNFTQADILNPHFLLSPARMWIISQSEWLNKILEIPINLYILLSEKSIAKPVNQGQLTSLEDFSGNSDIYDSVITEGDEEKKGCNFRGGWSLPECMAQGRQA
jgi:hypothetical protein